MREIRWGRRFIRSLKVAAASFAAIAAAVELGLNFSATAGIITILSIRPTKRETLKSALNRGLAFLCALVLSAVVFRLFGYTLWAFAVYLLLFSLFVLSVGLGEALANSSVLVSHFLGERSMGPSQVAELLGQIEQDYNRGNTAEELLEKQQALLLHMKEQRLPQSREEFESRAILFYILMQIRNLLELKREFCR